MNKNEIYRRQFCFSVRLFSAVRILLNSELMFRCVTLNFCFRCFFFFALFGYGTGVMVMAMVTMLTYLMTLFYLFRSRN